MKRFSLLAVLFFTSLLPSPATTLNVEAFGKALHGWKKDRTASYTINNNRYRTHRPTATRTQGGGLFISTRIEEGGRLSSGAVCVLELTFSPEGHPIAAQIRATMKGKRLDTGLVTRKAAAPLPTEGEGTAEAGAGWQTPTNTLVMDLFTRFDAELRKLDGKEGGRQRRDIFGRVTGSANKRTDVPAAIRHNLNLLLGHVGSGRGK
tara:strand:- start:23960 stop:24577 length:618 start_codon:yes stop_codon:yes gene_type:complete